MVDTNTKNKSFLRMSKYLYDLGIVNDNCLFMLETKNKSLVNFDYEANYTNELNPITGQTILDEILTECKNNIWFFFREIVRIPIPGLPHEYQYSMSFPLNMLSLKMIWSYEHNISFFATCSGSGANDCMRKITLELLCIYDYLFKTPNKKNIIFNTDEDSKFDLSMDFKLINKINSLLLPRLTTLYYNNLIDNSRPYVSTILSNQSNNVISHDKINMIKNDLTIHGFGFDMHKEKEKNIFTLCKVAKETQNNGIFMLEGDADYINNYSLETYLFHLMPDFDISLFMQSDTFIDKLKYGGIILLYENDFGFDHEWQQKKSEHKIVNVLNKYRLSGK